MDRSLLPSKTARHAFLSTVCQGVLAFGALAIIIFVMYQGHSNLNLVDSDFGTTTTSSATTTDNSDSDGLLHFRNAFNSMRAEATDGFDEVISEVLRQLEGFSTGPPALSTVPEPPSSSATQRQSLQMLASAALMDKSVEPCDNFYNYACGGYVASASLSPGETKKSPSFGAVSEAISKDLHSFVSLLLPVDPLFVYYDACLKMGAMPEPPPPPLPPLVANLMNQAVAVTTYSALMTTVGKLQLEGISTFFDYKIKACMHDPTKNCLCLLQGGLTMPRHMYVAKDTFPQMVAFEAAITAMFTAALCPQPDCPHVPARVAAAAAAAVLACKSVSEAENSIAYLFSTKKDQALHPRPEAFVVSALREKYKDFPLADALIAMGLEETSTVELYPIAYFNGLERLFQKLKNPFPLLSLYLQWRVLYTSSNYMAPFYWTIGATMRTVVYGKESKQLDRIYKCQKDTLALLPHEFGKTWATLKYTPAMDSKAKDIIASLKLGLKTLIMDAEWMDEESRKKAVNKLADLVTNVGRPTKWPHYVIPSAPAMYDLYSLDARKARAKHNLDMLSKEVSRTRWTADVHITDVTPSYDMDTNALFAPAALFMPPLFSTGMASDAQDYGGVGSLLGHYLLRGFDKLGQTVARDGSDEPMYSGLVQDRFDKRGFCVANIYEKFFVGKDHVFGNLTLAVDLDDIGGIRLAFLAFNQSSVSVKPLNETALHLLLLDEVDGTPTNAAAAVADAAGASAGADTGAGAGASAGAGAAIGAAGAGAGASAASAGAGAATGASATAAGVSAGVAIGGASAGAAADGNSTADAGKTTPPPSEATNSSTTTAAAAATAEKQAEPSESEGEPRPPCGGCRSRAEQRAFFLAYAQMYCSKATARTLEDEIETPVPPDRFRVNGPLAQLPEFADAFGCPAGAPMAPKERCPPLW